MDLYHISLLNSMMENLNSNPNMKVEVFYFTKKAFHDNPHSFFSEAKVTQKMLEEKGLENFCQVGEHTIPKADPFEVAEQIFALYNLDDNPLGTPEGQDKIRSLGVSHTSMSVNDFVVIDGIVYIVDNAGFLEADTLFSYKRANSLSEVINS